MLPLIWANLISSACLRGGRDDDDLLLAVEGRRLAVRPGVGVGLAFGRCGRRREERAEDLDALREHLDGRVVVQVVLAP